MKIHAILIFAMAMCLCGCAKTATSGKNDANKRYFDAWMQTHYPEVFAKGSIFPGYYILENTPGAGELVGEPDDSLYVRAHYTLSSLSGDISTSTIPEVNKQLGTYVEYYPYVPEVWYVDGMTSGLKNLITKMNVGQKCKIAVPGWLLTYNEYKTAQEYLDNESGDNEIYEIEIAEKIHKNITEWEIDSICRYIARHYPDKFSSDPALVRPDSVSTHGMYYIQLVPPADTSTIENDTTVYINYTGRLLNGQVFDTTIRDTAMKYGIWNSSTTYAPTVANLSSDYSNVTLGDDSEEVISGFARTLALMKSYEKGIGIFTSVNGYSYSGSGSTIPGYSPLIFEIELIDEPE